MSDYVYILLLAIIAVFAAIAANYARDIAYQVNALTVMIIAAGLFGWKVRRTGEPEPETGYNDWGVRAGVVATTL